VDQETADAHRRTRLANERTYLAWWRGGLTALAVSVGAGALVPDITSATRWPFVVLGVGFGLLAIAFIAYGVHRHRQVEQALARGGFAPLETRVAAALGLLGIVLALLTIAVVILEA
jgi:putative membrane protein